MKEVHEELRARLREAAEAHEPDRARILARVERGMAEGAGPEHRATRPPLIGWGRVVIATAAVAGVLGVGGFAVASAVKGEDTDRTVVVSPAPARSPDAISRPPVRPDASPPAKAPDWSPRSTPSPAPATRNPGVKAPLPKTSDNEDGPVWSGGSVDPHSNTFWAQSDVTLRTSEELTALTVELRIALTEGVSSTGAWRTLPERDFILTIREDDGFLVYRWVLKKGRTVPEGEFVFAGQYNHARGDRDAKDDRYRMAATADSERFSVGGGFARNGDAHRDTPG
jgi:hypothetical protein